MADFSDMEKKSEVKKPFIGYYGIWVTLTYLSIVSSLLGMFLALNGKIGAAIFCLMVCGLCDMFDGTVARMRDRTKDQESYGIQVDAIADIVSFGVFPVILGYSIGAHLALSNNQMPAMIISFAIANFYVLAAVIRLAYFNVMEIKLHDKNERRTHYVGMPVTLVSLLIPLLYAVCIALRLNLAFVYNIMLLVFAIAFLLKFKTPKIRGRYLLFFILAGVPIAVFLIWSIGVRS